MRKGVREMYPGHAKTPNVLTRITIDTTNTVLSRVIFVSTLPRGVSLCYFKASLLWNCITLTVSTQGCLGVDDTSAA
jgi:hypothetical protein